MAKNLVLSRGTTKGHGHDGHRHNHEGSKRQDRSVAKVIGGIVGSLKSVAITADNPFKGRQRQRNVIILCVRCYPLSFEHVAELTA